MKLTKYPQSCVLIETDNARLLIDPGNHFTDAGFKPAELGKIDAVLYTHQHGDHYDQSVCEYFMKNNVPIYCNQATAALINDAKTHIVWDGESFDINSVPVQARELPHSPMLDGSEGPQNTGYVINGVFFHPGDGYALDGLTVDSLALPITGPDISIRDAIAFAVQVGAKLVVPIHYHGIPMDPRGFGGYFAKYAEAHPEYKPATYVVLEEGKSIELPEN